MESKTNNNTVAFFDLDNTLVRTSTGILWFRYMRRKGHTSFWEVAKAFYAYLRYRRNSLDVRSLAEREVKRVAGMSEDRMIEICQQWFDEMVKDYIYPRAVDVVNDHKAKGHTLAILSAATIYAVGPVKNHLGIEHGLCTRLAVNDGMFTGELVEPYCYGEGKIYWAERFAEENGISLENCYFYTDSITDLPMLEKVGLPQVVNPDKLLEAEARKRNWPITSF
jgi:putative phosphoserine phosphatase/1-acylglycerol-3-phosphate O-acyltransferase